MLCSVSRSSAWRSSCRRLCHCRSCFSFSCNCRSFSCSCVWSDSSDSCCLSASCFCWLSCWAMPARSARVPCTSCSRCSVSLPISSAGSVSTRASSSGWRMTAAAWVGASLALAPPSAPARRAGGTRRRSDRLGTLADTGSGAGAARGRGSGAWRIPRRRLETEGWRYPWRRRRAARGGASAPGRQAPREDDWRCRRRRRWPRHPLPWRTAPLSPRTRLAPHPRALPFPPPAAARARRIRPR